MALEPGVPILRGARDRVDEGEGDQTLERFPDRLFWRSRSF
jgi:hypothetical protein